MDMELVLDIIKDALKDSFMVFAFVFLVHFLLAFIEEKLANNIAKRSKSAPLLGSLFGLIPQCGTSVLGADLYIKKYISVGALVAIFLSCSDEAFIIMITSWNERSIMIFPLIGLKFLIGLVSGIIIDLLFNKKEEVNHVYHEDHKCHQHHHEENTPIHKYFLHPLFHSLEIFLYVLVINLALGFIIAGVGEDNFTSFLLNSRYLAPLYSGVIGMIPNCSSSILITELYMKGSLSFGALLSGLLVNSGLGMMILLKNKATIKKALFILLTCFLIAVASGYIACIISGF